MKKLILTCVMLSALSFSSLSVHAQEVDFSKINGNHQHDRHHHHHHHNNKHHKLLKKHKKEVVQYLANYLNQPEANVTKIVDEQKIEMKKLIFVSVIAKLSNKPLENVIAEENKKQSFKELLNTYHINRDQFFNEMNRVHKDIFSKIKSTKN